MASGIRCRPGRAHAGRAILRRSGLGTEGSASAVAIFPGNRGLKGPLRLLRPFGGGLRLLALWGLPPLVLALVLVSGFAWWCVASQAGTRWLLHTVVAQMDGQIQGVQGTIARGLSVRDLAIALPDAEVHL